MGRPKGVKNQEENVGENQVADQAEETAKEVEKVEPKLKAPKKKEVEEEPRLEAPEEKMATETGDYLLKYQYRKQTPFGSVASNPAPGSKAEKMKAFLLSSPKVRMFIPQTPGEDISIPQSVCLNGYRLDFPKQTYLDVPEPVANVLMESLKQTEVAIMRNRIDGDSKKENALL